MELSFSHDLLSRVDILAAKLGMERSRLILSAVEDYLEEMEDVAEAEAYLSRTPQEPTIPLDEIKRKYDLT